MILLNVPLESGRVEVERLVRKQQLTADAANRALRQSSCRNPVLASASRANQVKDLRHQPLSKRIPSRNREAL